MYASRIAAPRTSRQRMLNRAGVLAALCLGVLTGGANAQERHGAEYFPRALGYSWKYVNELDPDDFRYEDVFGSRPYGGYADAWMVGTDPCNYLIEFNDGVGYILLGGLAECVEVDFDDVDLSVIVDGTTYPDLGGDPGFTVIRLWENLDHNLTGEYGIDPTLPDVIVFVWYDSLFEPNDQNVILESGGGVSYHAAVTHIGFYREGIGPIALLDVDAESGLIGRRELVFASFDCNGNQIADHTDIDTGTSEDLDGNGIPDECEECPPDLTGDGVVDTRDFLLFLGAWVQRDPVADWDGNGVVDTRDFFAYLNDWVAGC